MDNSKSDCGVLPLLFRGNKFWRHFQMLPNALDIKKKINPIAWVTAPSYFGQGHFPYCINIISIFSKLFLSLSLYYSI